MDGKKCLACGQGNSPSPTHNRNRDRYCYQHQQVYDILVSEYKAILNAYSNDVTSWKEFLLKKLDGNEPTDVIKVLDAELKKLDSQT
jgi:hypothetical protein